MVYSLSEAEFQKVLTEFRMLLEKQQHRVDDISKASDWVDYASKDKIVIGVCYGDGIGEVISKQTMQVLEHVLKDALASHSVEFKIIEGLTLENRIKHKQAIPEDVLAELKTCDVILKGPTTTPQVGGDVPNIGSANVKMRRELDLFANIRPISVPEKGIEWYFFRENTLLYSIMAVNDLNVNLIKLKSL